MRRLITTAISLFMTINMFAQTQETQQWLSDSSRAIQFGIGDYFGVRAFDTKSISYKFHLSSDRAVRFGVSFSGFTEKNEYDRTTVQGSNGVPSVQHFSNPSYSFASELLILHLWYIDTGSDVFLFFGAGPLGQYSRKNYGGSYSEVTTSWSVGASGAIGVEWFVHRKISLHSEYQAAGQYSHSINTLTDIDYSTTPNQTTTREGTANRWSITSQRVLFGFSVYF